MKLRAQFDPRSKEPLMIVSVEIPDAFAKRLHLEGVNASRRALELLALEGYRSGELARGHVAELLGLSFFETEEFLKANHAPIELTMDEFQRSSAGLERLLGQ